MLALVLFGSIGISGFAYLLLSYFWPGWYLDYVYRKAYFKTRVPLFNRLAKKQLLIDIFEEMCNTYRQKPFIIYEDQKLSYDFFDRKANQLARAMVDIGVVPGSTVAVVLRNEPAIVWTYLGLMKGGYQTAFINYNLRARSLAHCIRTSGASVLLVGEGEELVEAVRDVKQDIPGINVYLQGATSEQKPPGFMSFELVMSRMSDKPIDKSVRKHVTLMSTNIYIYTSGTTGLPKPAILSHARCVGGSYSFNVFDMTSDDILYETLPMYHSAALLVGFGNTISHGATMILKDKFSASQFWDDCRKHNATIIQYIGEVCRYLLAKPKSEMDGVHKVRTAFGNGLRQDIWLEFKNRFKIPRIVEFYGATESPIGVSNVTNQVGACGRSSPYLRQFTPAVFVKYDLESQSPARNKQGWCIPIKPNEIGLLIVPLIEGKTVFNGYKTKSDTQKKILHDVFVKGDKYFNSGDLIKVDANYYLYFNDRVGDTFRWKGENVSTTEVGNVLTELPFIQDANVYGVTVPGADGRAGMVALHLMEEVPQQISAAMLSALLKHVTKYLPSYAQPKFIRVQTNLEVTSTFKQLKTMLVKEGFDVNKIKEPLFYLDSRTHSYLPLDQNAYENIIAKRISF